MLEVLYEDGDVLVCVKPAGVESQSSRSFKPDMVSIIRNHLSRTAVPDSTGYPHYVGVIHRLDKPVEGIMVYGKHEKAAKSLSYQLQSHQIEKKYYALVCGKPVDNHGELVDYLWKSVDKNISEIVDARKKGAKRAVLKYQVENTMEVDGRLLSLVRIDLLTGRHHQIRLQMSGLGHPLWGDFKYNPMFAQSQERASLALCADRLSFEHPGTKQRMEFKMVPRHPLLSKFLNYE